MAKKHLVYTVLFDAPDSGTYRLLGKMLVSSLLKTFFGGDIVVFRNSPAPLFLVERKGLEEVFLDTPEMYGQERAEFSWSWKYKVAELIENPEQYDKILFLDADCLSLRNLDHLLEGDWDIRYQPERDTRMHSLKYNSFLTEEEMRRAGQFEGVNSGTLAVKGSRFHEVMDRWREIDESRPARESGFHDQASWNALLLREGKGFSVQSPEEGKAASGSKTDWAWKAEPFPAGEVQFPGYLDPEYLSYTRAALTHNLLPDSKQKIEFTFGLYMRTFYCDPHGTLLSLLEI